MKYLRVSREIRQNLDVKSLHLNNFPRAGPPYTINFYK